MKSPCHNAGEKRAHNGILLAGQKVPGCGEFCYMAINPYLAVRGKNKMIANTLIIWLK